MKKKLALILSAVMLTMTLAACGEGEDREDDGKSGSKTGKVTDVAVDSKPSGPFQIELYGENKAVITFTHEKVLEVLNNKEREGKFLDFRFIGGDEQKLSSSLNMNEWTLCPQNFDGSEPEWFAFVPRHMYIEKGSTVSCVINRPGVCAYFRECEFVQIGFYDGNIKDDLKWSVILDCELSSCMKEIETSQIVEVFIENPDRVGVKINSTEAALMLKEVGLLSLELYKEDTMEGAGADMTFQMDTNSGDEDYFRAYGGVRVPYSDGYTNEPFLDEYGGYYQATGYYTDYGITFLFDNVGIEELINGHFTYKLIGGLENKTEFESGYVQDMISEKSYYEIESMPDIFPKNAEDAEYFFPTTDKYMLAVIDVPNFSLYETDWFTQGGEVGYEVLNSLYEVPVKIVYIESYDAENYVVDLKVKMIFPTAEDAMHTPLQQWDRVYASDILGVNQKDDSILDIWSQQRFSAFDNFSCRADNTLYFNQINNSSGFYYRGYDENLGALRTAEYTDGYYRTTEKITCYDNNGDSITEYTLDKPIVAYRSDGGIDWRSHPYIQYAPPFPAGSSVRLDGNYTPNKYQINLEVDCTLEQARAYIEVVKRSGFNIEVYEDNAATLAYYYASNSEGIRVEVAFYPLATHMDVRISH